MASQRERIIAHPWANPEGSDDDELSAALGIEPRQTVNRICRELFAAGMIRRGRDTREGKLVNRIRIGGTGPPR